MSHSVDNNAVLYNSPVTLIGTYGRVRSRNVTIHEYAPCPEYALVTLVYPYPSSDRTWLTSAALAFENIVIWLAVDWFTPA